MEAYDITPTRRCGLCHVATDFLGTGHQVVIDGPL